MSPSARLQNHSLIECIDLTAESLDPFREPTVGGNTKVHFKDPSIGADPTGGQDDSDGPFISIEEVQCSAGEGQEPQDAVSSIEHGSQKAGGAAERPALIDCDSGDAHPPGATRSGDTRRETDDRGGDHSRSCQSSDGSISREQGAQRGSPDKLAVPRLGPENRYFRYYDNTQSSTSELRRPCPSPPHATVAPLVRSSISQVQTESKDSALTIRTGSSAEAKEMADTDDGHKEDGRNEDGDRSSTSAIGVRHSPKRTAVNAGFNERDKVVPRSGKVQRIDNTDHDQFMARIRSLPEPVFRPPPSPGDPKPHENISNSTQSNETGDSQENPFTIEEDDDKPGENGCSTRATSIESTTGPAPLQRSPPREPEADGCSSTQNTEPSTRPVNRPIPPSATLQPLYKRRTTLPKTRAKRTVGEHDQGAVAVTSPPSATLPPLSPQLPVSKTAIEEQEWEISKIIDKRRAGWDYEYKVRWKSTWLPRSELGNAQQLLQEFEARLRAEPNFSFKTRILV